MTNYGKDFASRLKHAMNIRQLKAVDLCNKTGLSSALISQYLSGKFEAKNDKAYLLSDALRVSPTWLLGFSDDMFGNDSPTRPSSIPVLGVVPCGMPIEAIEDIVDWIDVVPSQATGHFGLIAKGDSMAPYILDGDILIVKQVPIVDSGKIAIVKVNGDDATCKKVLITDAGITLLPLNSAYEPRFISAGDCQQLPVSIVGEVVEIRRRFKK